MYDINLKNVKKRKVEYYALLLAGIFFLVSSLGLFLYTTTKKNSIDSSVLSKNVEMKSSSDGEGALEYTLYYKYEVNEKEYVCSSTFDSKVGLDRENKTIYYDSKNPSNCMTESEYKRNDNIVLLIFLIISTPLIIVPIYNIIKINKRVKTIKNSN